MSGEAQLTIFLLAVWIAVAVYLYRIYHRQDDDEPEQNDLIDCRELQQEVAELHRMMQRLAELDNAIIDLKLCRPAENLRTFQIHWQSAAGTEHSLDFMADGESESSESFKAWAVNERTKLNQEIAQRIYDLYAKASYINCYTSENLSGEWSEAAELVDGERIKLKKARGSGDVEGCC